MNTTIEYPESLADVEDFGAYEVVGRARSLSDAEALCVGPGTYVILPASRQYGVTTWKVLHRAANSATPDEKRQS